MGRKTDSIWAFFKKIEKDGKTRALCNNCQKDLVPLKNHVSKCKASPPANEIDIIDEPGPSTSKRKKQDVLPFIGTGPTQQHQLDIQITRLVFIRHMIIIFYTHTKHLNHLIQYIYV